MMTVKWIFLEVFLIFVQSQVIRGYTDVQELKGIQNFRDEVYNANHASFVYFHSKNCTVCETYAETFGEVEHLMKFDRRTVRFYSVECSPGEGICAVLGILKFPTVKYFPEQSDPSESTTLVIKDYSNVWVNIRVFVRHIVSEQKHGRGLMIPNLRPYEKSSLNPLRKTRALTFLMMILADERISAKAALTILRLQKENIVVRYATLQNKKLFDRLGIKMTPYVIAIDNGKIRKLGLKLSYLDTIEKYLNRKLIQSLTSEELQTHPGIETNPTQPNMVPGGRIISFILRLLPKLLLKPLKLIVSSIKFLLLFLRKKVVNDTRRILSYIVSFDMVRMLSKVLLRPLKLIMYSIKFLLRFLWKKIGRVIKLIVEYLIMAPFTEIVFSISKLLLPWMYVLVQNYSGKNPSNEFYDILGVPLVYLSSKFYVIKNALLHLPSEIFKFYIPHIVKFSRKLLEEILNFRK